MINIEYQIEFELFNISELIKTNPEILTKKAALYLHKIFIFENRYTKTMQKGWIKGHLGELDVRFKLEAERSEKEVKHKGGQGAIDIILKHRHRIASNIDVKMSTFKNDLNKFDYMWRWDLLTKSKKPGRKMPDHFICVSYDEDLNPKAYFVLNFKDMHLFPDCPDSRYKYVKKSFFWCPHGASNLKPFQEEMVIKCHELVAANTAKIIYPHQSLANVLYEQMGFTD